MISFGAVHSPSAAASYLQETFKETKGSAEYYANEKTPSEWGGKAAAFAELQEGVRIDKDDFVRALSGRFVARDGQDQQLGKRLQSGEIQHRAGWDFTISAPKSVSVVGLVGGDERVLAAHSAAVKTTMRYAEERGAFARITQNRTTEAVRTGNLLYAMVQHETSRDLDPQLHTHVVVVNATFDEKSGRWYSLSNEWLVKNRGTLDAVYKNELARNLKSLGYNLRWTKDGPEIAGIDREHIEQFSGRRQAIINGVREKFGKDVAEASFAERQAATLATRAHKVHVEREHLVDAWQKTAREAGLDLAALRERAEKAPVRQVDEKTVAMDAVDRAIRHLTERELAFRETSLIRESLRFGRGDMSIETLSRHIDNMQSKGLVVDAKHLDVNDDRTRDPAKTKRDTRVEHDRFLTTPRSIARETGIVRDMLRGQGRMTPIATDLDVDHVLSQSRDITLNDGQASAVRLALTTKDRFVGVQGYAGTGKTTMLRVLRGAAEDLGFQVRGMSAGAKQAGVLESETGIKSQTIARALIDMRTGAVDQAPQVWVMDEASMTSAKDMAEVMRWAEKYDAHVVMLGDIKQHQAVESGSPFEQLINAGMATAYMTEIHRQQDQAGKEAVAAIAKPDVTGKDVVEAINRLQAAGQVVEKDTDGEVKAAIANDYKMHLEEGIQANRVAVITATNADRRELNEAIRDAKIGAGLMQKGRDFETLQPVDMTKQEIRMVTSFQEAASRIKEETGRQSVTFVLRAEAAYPAKGINRGDYLTVEALNPQANTLMVKNQDGKRFVLNPAENSKFSVYQAENREFSVGDRVMFLRNDKEYKAINGWTGEIKSLDGTVAAVALDNGRTLKIDLGAYKHVDHAYAMTTYKAQGETVDKTLYHLPAAKGAIGQRAFYVGITRARQGTTIYSDGLEYAADRAAAIVDKTTARDDHERVAIAQARIAKRAAPQQDQGREQGDREHGIGESVNARSQEQTAKAQPQAQGQASAQQPAAGQDQQPVADQQQAQTQAQQPAKEQASSAQEHQAQQQGQDPARELTQHYFGTQKGADAQAFKKSIAAAIKVQPQHSEPGQAKLAVTRAAQHLTGTEHAFRETDLLREAIRFADGKARVDDLVKEIRAQIDSGRLLRVEHIVADRGENRYLTTPQARQVESDIIRTMRDTKDSMRSITDYRSARDWSDRYETARGFAMSEGERDAVVRTLTSKDAYVGVDYRTQAGRDTAIRSIADIAKHGYHASITGLSSTAAGAKEMAEKTGIEHTASVGAHVNAVKELPGRLQESINAMRDSLHRNLEFGQKWENTLAIQGGFLGRQDWGGRNWHEPGLIGTLMGQTAMVKDITGSWRQADVSDHLMKAAEVMAERVYNRLEVAWEAWRLSRLEKQVQALRSNDATWSQVNRVAARVYRTQARYVDRAARNLRRLSRGRFAALFKGLVRQASSFAKLGLGLRDEKLAQQYFESFRAKGAFADRANELSALAAKLRDQADRFREAANSRHHVWVVNDAHRIGARDMHDLVQTTSRFGDVRVVLAGNARETQGVAAGRVFDQMVRGGMTTARLNDAPVAKTAAMRAVQEKAERSPAEAFQELDRQGKVQEARDVVRAAAETYVRERDVTIIAPNQELANKINAETREQLKAAGELKDGKAFETYQPISMSDAEKSHAPAWRDALGQEGGKGIVLVAERDRDGAMRGDVLRLDRVNVEASSLTMTNLRTGERVTVKAEQTTSLTPYRVENREIAVGDRIVTLRSDRAAGAVSNERLTVTAINGDRITAKTQDGQTKTFDTSQFKQINHGYAVTHTQSAGQRHDKAVIVVPGRSEEGQKFHDIERDRQFDQANKLGERQFYQAVASTDRDLRVLTNDKQSALEQVTRATDKTTAIAVEPLRGKSQEQQSQKTPQAADYEKIRSATGQELRNELARMDRSVRLDTTSQAIVDHVRAQRGENAARELENTMRREITYERLAEQGIERRDVEQRMRQEPAKAQSQEHQAQQQGKTAQHEKDQGREQGDREQGKQALKEQAGNGKDSSRGKESDDHGRQSEERNESRRTAEDREQTQGMGRGR